MSEDKNWILKCCLLGEANVGKTSLAHRFIENTFSNSYKATLGVNLMKKDLKIDNNEVSTQVWDLGGQESFRSLRKLYLEGANGALVVFDVTNRKSFEKLEDWINDFREILGDKWPLVLIGNKADLKVNMKVSKEEAQAYADKLNLQLIITSAKTGENVENAFKNLIKSILKVISLE
ncbi:MAG: Rab family GTPase [Promethearchaeota archaeon]